VMKMCAMPLISIGCVLGLAYQCKPSPTFCRDLWAKRRVARIRVVTTRGCSS